MSADLTIKEMVREGRNCAQNDDDVALFSICVTLRTKSMPEYSRPLVETCDRNRRDVR